MGRAGRRVLIAIVVVLVLLVAADRISVHVLAGQIATRAQRAEALPTRPDVSIDGFPFLTQVVSGKYHDVKVTVRGFQQNGPRVESIKADLKGVHVPLSDGLRGTVLQVPVDRVTASVHVTFTDINAYLATQNQVAKVSGAGSLVRITGPVTILGTSYSLAGNAALGLIGDTVTLTPTAVSQAVGALLPPGLREAAIGRLTVKLPVTGLPFNLHLTSARVDGDGLTVTAGGTSVVLTNTAATAG
ncbi:MAG: LmeA family phospholipid-binding protein [Frankia sp.]